MMSMSELPSGRHVRLERLDHRHVEGLVEAAAADPSLYEWSPVPQGRDETIRYVEDALALRKAGSAVPFAIIRTVDDQILGSTRFWNVERWPWPEGHIRHGREEPDGCEIGYTWLTKAAIRTGANTEAKLLLLTHAFETWRTLRVCFHADARNIRSAVALERLGAKYEGLLRAHRIAVDHVPRDSRRYSIVAAEWPGLKEQLINRLDRT
jgi:RimJ/RimL family protein N-acetyltransferase